MIRKLLIANRGEIACRIMRTARRMGINCAAVYSEADRDALHVQMADVAFCIGPAPAPQSYLNARSIIDAAISWGADAVHPGYGFLSENSGFAKAVTEAGLIFVGPSEEAIAAMGSKSRAKALMQAAGIPLLPGYHAEEQDLSTLQKAADELGFPLLIKAVSGGGGRGLRVVHHTQEFADALTAVQRESQAAFADQRVLLERFLPNARHVEVQIFADNHGHCLHLFERDCSIQRRHQKLIEEAPAPGLSEDVRRRMGEAAVNAARRINYSGAGTVEFLYQDDAFYFMEMNTRLQVEHPVTEAITGIDLVEWQLRVAQGEMLPLQQQDIKADGWAIEARLNAEDPQQGFLPSSGPIHQLIWPEHERLRIDTGFRTGDRVSIYYDSLLAKLIVLAPQREQAARILAWALGTLRLSGIHSNAAFLQAVLEHPAFLNAQLNTAFLQQHEQALSVASGFQTATGDAAQSEWGSLSAWRNLGHNPHSRSFHLFLEPAPGHDEDGSSGANTSVQSALKAPLPGRVIALSVSEGDRIEAGQLLIVMEAMKMEHSIRASAPCTVVAVHCSVDESVQPDQLLMEFAALADEAEGDPQ